jgi:hypothetical protein
MRIGTLLMNECTHGDRDAQVDDNIQCYAHRGEKLISVRPVLEG